MNIHDRIDQYCEQGNELFDENKYLDAIAVWQKAFDAIPDLDEGWSEALWLKVSIGDSYYMIDEYEKSLDAFLDALNYPEAIDNPFIHFRIGQCYYELGDKDYSKNSLLKAYMLAGKEIFDEHEEEGEFYYKFLSSSVQL